MCDYHNWRQEDGDAYDRQAVICAVCLPDGSGVNREVHAPFYERLAVKLLRPTHPAGGLGFFLGDGRLNYETEKVVETFYSLKAGKFMWVSLDYQHIRNPGYNADRGPANFFGIRLHVEN